jgi:hypothetical protein
MIMITFGKLESDLFRFVEKFPKQKDIESCNNKKIANLFIRKIFIYYKSRVK